MTETAAQVPEQAPTAVAPADPANGMPAEAPAQVAAPRLTMLEGMKVVFDAKVGLQPVRLVRREDTK